MAKNSGSTNSFLKTTKIALSFSANTTIPVGKPSFNFPQKLSKIASVYSNGVKERRKVK